MKYFKSKQVNNKGFSLVELIVTILIVAIISGGAIMSISVVYNANTDRAARRLVMALSEVRQEAMAGEENCSYYLKLYYDGDNILSDVCKEEGGAVTVLATKEIGNKQVTIKAGQKGTPEDDFDTLAAGSDHSGLIFEFEKKRGELSDGGWIDADGNMYYGVKYVDIRVTGNLTNNVIIVPATGRSYIYKGEDE